MKTASEKRCMSIIEMANCHTCFSGKVAVSDEMDGKNSATLQCVWYIEGRRPREAARR